MANSIRGLCKLNITLANNVFRKINFVNVGVRFLYTEKSIGVTAYEAARQLFHNQFASIENTFRSKMLEVCEKDDGVIFIEDLKAMLHLAQKTESDMNLVLKMLEKYQLTSQNHKFGSYNFGPVVMRMFYYLREPQLALSAISNPDLIEFFNQRASFQVVLCLLYQFEMYSEMRQVFTSLLESEITRKHSLSCMSILLAACYKENTPESFTYALNCWKTETSSGTISSGRATTLLAAMALKHDSPEIALEILSTLQRQSFVNVRCIKVLAYMKLHKYIHIIPLIKVVLDQDIGSLQKNTYFGDVIYALEDQLRNEEQGEDVVKLITLIEEAKRQECVTMHLTLEENLLKPISFASLADRQKHLNKRPVKQTSSTLGMKSFL